MVKRFLLLLVLAEWVFITVQQALEPVATILFLGVSLQPVAAVEALMVAALHPAALVAVAGGLSPWLGLAHKEFLTKVMLAVEVLQQAQKLLPAAAVVAGLAL
jgi:hypothetical protein